MTRRILLVEQIQEYLDAAGIEIPAGVYHAGVIVDPEARTRERFTYNNRMDAGDSFYYAGSGPDARITLDVTCAGTETLTRDHPLTVFLGDRGGGGDLEYFSYNCGVFSIVSEGEHVLRLDQVPGRDTDDSGYYLLVVHDRGGDADGPYGIGQGDIAALYRTAAPGNLVFGGLSQAPGTPVFPGDRREITFAPPPAPAADPYEPDNTDRQGTIVSYNDLPVSQVHTFHDTGTGDADTDWYRIFLRAGDALVVETLPAGGSWIAATAMKLRSQRMEDVADNVDKNPGDAFSRIEYVNARGPDQWYYLSIGTWGGDGTHRHLGEYVVEFRTAEDSTAAAAGASPPAPGVP
jgi:hypothetical protein